MPTCSLSSDRASSPAAGEYVDGKRLYVTLPVAGQLATIDMESFKVIEAIKGLLPPVNRNSFRVLRHGRRRFGQPVHGFNEQATRGDEEQPRVAEGSQDGRAQIAVSARGARPPCSQPRCAPG